MLETALGVVTVGLGWRLFKIEGSSKFSLADGKLCLAGGRAVQRIPSREDVAHAPDCRDTPH